MTLDMVSKQNCAKAQSWLELELGLGRTSSTEAWLVVEHNPSLSLARGSSSNSNHFFIIYLFIYFIMKSHWALQYKFIIFLLFYS